MEENLKQLVLIDISARLPYGVILRVGDHKVKITTNNTWVYFGASDEAKEYIKPYLRPWSALTEKEREEYENLKSDVQDHFKVWKCKRLVEWAYKHHLDINDMIPMGLAIEAPKDMYNF